MLSGRLGDLFAVYAVYTGGLMVVMFLCMLPVMLAAAVNEKLGLLVMAIACCLIFGVSVDLLGRLCGFFACGEIGLTAKPEPVKSSPAPANEPVRPKKPVQPSMTSIPVAPDPLMQKAQAAAPAKAQAPVPVTPPDLSAPADGGKKPPLMDAQQRVARALNRFDHDPQGAISALVEMRNTFAAHPQVEQALTLCLFRGGQTEAALQMAKDALPLCLERGHSQLAAVIYKEMGAELDPQELNGEQIIAIAAALAKMEEWMTAAKAYVKIIERDPGEARAIKGMLQVADGILYKKSKPEAAAKIYRYLLANCSPSPFVSLMQDGLKEAEKRISQAV